MPIEYVVCDNAADPRVRKLLDDARSLLNVELYPPDASERHFTDGLDRLLDAKYIVAKDSDRAGTVVGAGRMLLTPPPVYFAQSGLLERLVELGEIPSGTTLAQLSEHVAIFYGIARDPDDEYKGRVSDGLIAQREELARSHRTRFAVTNRRVSAKKAYGARQWHFLREGAPIEDKHGTLTPREWCYQVL